jgi:hypothetical protein
MIWSELNINHLLRRPSVPYRRMVIALFHRDMRKINVTGGYTKMLVTKHFSAYQYRLFRVVSCFVDQIVVKFSGTEVEIDIR